MKSFLVLALVLSTNVFAQTDSQILTTAPIDVDGYIKEKDASDGELDNIRSEIANQKKEIVLNKEKSKQYQELSKSVEKLSETTEVYLEEKRAAQEQIAEYNLKVKCLQAEEPGPECDRYVRRRR